jgi:hypothetical protein
MRAKWTPWEQAALGSFARALTAFGVLPVYDPTVSDSPEAVFYIDGRRVGIECRYLGRPELVKFSKKRNLVIAHPPR